MVGVTELEGRHPGGKANTQGTGQEAGKPGEAGESGQNRRTAGRMGQG